MQKIIWACWFQGRDQAPKLVRKCLDSWELRNPEWDLRVLDAFTLGRYIDLSSHIDLEHQKITAASLADIVRLLLLHEYGGVWVDATTFCNVALDDWLTSALGQGFFAFARPGEDRPLASWFLAAAPGNQLLAKWTARALGYWRDRERTTDYFWLHHQFGELCSIDLNAFRAWQAVPRIDAAASHAIQTTGPYLDFNTAKGLIDWTCPVFKLTHRIDEALITPDSLIGRLVGFMEETAADTTSPTPHISADQTKPIGQLKVATENLGDHIQILAAERLLSRAGLTPCFYVDRDNEIASRPPLPEGVSVGILMNGWFKTNPAEWPPHPHYDPVYLGFHIRPFQAPSLISPDALSHYAEKAPIGCRDRYTQSLLLSHGVDAFLSHCLTLTWPKRIAASGRQTEIFVVSRNRDILRFVPESIGPYTFISQYADGRDFEANKAKALELLEVYRTRARLIVTTMLHCALPAIAMGIPVVVIYPPNEGDQHISDQERFSSLSELIRVYRHSETGLVDWAGFTPDIGHLKLRLIDKFFEMAGRWGPLQTPSIEATAPSAELPVPARSFMNDYLNDPQRLERIAEARSPDRQRWGAPSSYKPEWNERGRLAAQFIRDGSKVLEIGVGAGAFRTLVVDRCQYTGADLEPIDSSTIALDLDNDPIPARYYDTIVCLGVLEYIHNLDEAINKIVSATSDFVVSYCCMTGDEHSCKKIRRDRGWVNFLREDQFISKFIRLDFQINQRVLINSADDFAQYIFQFQRI